jgi:uncharacterized membrane protein YvbJ
MVYCRECGTKNEDTAEVCVKCDAKLHTRREKSLEKRAEEWGEEVGKSVGEWGEQFGKRAEEWGESFGKRAEEECFGLPYSGTIFGIVIGIIIILVGISMMPGIDLRIWPLILLIFGVMIVAGSLYALKQRG